MNSPRKVPERTCLSCRRRMAKIDLIRHVWNGQFTPDVAAILPGRGYYCCAEPACQAVFARRAAAVRKRKGEGKRDEA